LQRPRILVVDDEPALGLIVEEVLTDHGCDVRVAGSAEDALPLMAEATFDVALLDIVLPGMNGLKLLEKIKEKSPRTEVLMMTSQSSVESVLHAIRHGAYDYLQKPLDDIEEVWLNVQRVLEKIGLKRENDRLLEESESRNRELSAAVMRLTSFIEAGNAMSEFDSLPKLLDFFLGLITAELGVARASLMLLGLDTGVLTIAAHRGLDAFDTSTVRVPLGEGIAGRVAQTGAHVLVADVHREWSGRDARTDLASSFLSAPVVLSVPIKSTQAVLGVINLTNRQSGTPFSKEDLAYVTGMAGQLAVAIERARHYQELQAAYESLQAAQEQLVYSERRKVIGEMAAGVAHDFNNDLSIILGKAELALRRLSSDDPAARAKVPSDLAMVARIALHGAETIKRIQDYTRIRRDSPKEPVDLGAVVKSALEMTQPKWCGEANLNGAPIEVRLDLASTPRVAGHEHELTQMISNLVFNAVEAMPRGGTLTLTTRADGARVILEISDTGTGMDEETLRKVFEPFFTTKETGNGLGTSVVFGIVKRHGGDITVSSRPGEGTSFRISLPIASEGVAHEPRESDDTRPRAARILLVDDEELVRRTALDLLVSEGHFVAEADSISAALNLARRELFDLVITDMSMQKGSGLELVRELKKIDQDLPVVLLSGWAVQKGEAELARAGVDFVVTKPCSLEVLSQTVQRALNLHPGSCDPVLSKGDSP
jgi:signal transduction histidine kinase/DNA-binding response OmpR family regulator